MTFFDFESSVISDAPNNVEIISFETDNSLLVSAVDLNTEYKATSVEPFDVKIKVKEYPKKLMVLPDEIDVPFTYSDGYVSFKSKKLNLFDMYKILY